MILFHYGIEKYEYDLAGVWEWKIVKSNAILAKDHDCAKEYVLEKAKERLGIDFTNGSKWVYGDGEDPITEGIEYKTEGNFRVSVWDTEYDDMFEFDSSFVETLLEKLLKMNPELKVLSTEED